MRNVLLLGDALTQLRTIPDQVIQSCVTSPPYWALRDYGAEGQIGQEPTPWLYVDKLVEVFREVRRVLRDDGTLWLNLGDSYAGSWGNQGRKAERGTQRPVNGPIMQNFGGYGDLAKKSKTGSWVKDDAILKDKDLIGVPWRVAFALQEDGWYLRSDIIWSKPNCMPESISDRPTKSHEYVFLLAKSKSYFYNLDAVREPAESAEGSNPLGRNKRTVWTINPKPYKGAHFAVMPAELAEVCIKAGSKKGDLILDPFAGSGTTLAVARSLLRDYIGIELNDEYKPLIEERLNPVEDLNADRSIFAAMEDMDVEESPSS